MASTDPYRDYMTEEDLAKKDYWMNDEIPNYDVVNKLFEEGRTTLWPIGSLEEKVQRLVKTWEMELVHKIHPQDYGTADPNNMTISMNGTKKFTLAEVGAIGGSYNLFLHTSLPPYLRYYDPDQESYESSQTAFKKTFARGFAFEILEVFSGPPLISLKFRHWGYMDAPFKGQGPTGELVEFFGTSIFELDGDTFESKVVRVEHYCDRGELLSGLIVDKNPSGSASGCPFMAQSSLVLD